MRFSRKMYPIHQNEALFTKPQVKLKSQDKLSVLSSFSAQLNGKNRGGDSQSRYGKAEESNRAA